MYKMFFPAVYADISCYPIINRAGSTDTNIGRLQQRVVDLLHFWLEGYYSIDFQYNQDLMQTLRNFIKDHVSMGMGLGRGGVG